MRSKTQKKLNSFMVAESEANHHYPDCSDKSEEGINRFKRFLWSQPVRTAKYCANIFSIFLVILTLCFGGGVTEALGATYYVKNGGNDKLAGTSDATAWARCPGMAGWSGTATLSPGDIVYFREAHVWTSTARPILATKNGVAYYGKGYGSTGTRAKLQSLVGTASGTPSDGVIDINASNVTVKGFEVDANQQSIGGIYIGYGAVSDITDTVIDDCVVHDIGGDEASITEYYYGILVGQRNLHATRNVSITNCEVYNTGHEGIAIYPSRNYGNFVENVTVRGCTIHDTGHWGGTSWGHGIYIALHTSNILVEYNTVYNTYSIGVATYADHPTTFPYTVGYPDNVTIRYNIVYNSLNQIGIALNTQNNSWTGWGNIYIYGNILYNNRLHVGGGNFWNKEVKIYNNTIYNTILNSKGIWIYKTASNTSGIEIKNNLIYTGAGTAAICLDDEGALLTENLHSNNLYYRASGTLVLNGPTYYNSSNINSWESTAQNADPLFAAGTLPNGFIETIGDGMIPNANYFAAASANAVYNGATLGTPYNGCINWTGSANVACRPAGAYDIGAYQTATVVTTPVPRTKVSKLSKVN